VGSNYREVPKSITFKGAPSLEVSNKRFSGFKSLKKVNDINLPVDNLILMAIKNG